MNRFPPSYLPFLLAVGLGLASCDTPVPRQVAFHEADFAAYRGPGTATVTGHLVVSTWDGVKVGSRTTVELVPVNAYTQEMVDTELVQGFRLSPEVDERFKKYARIVTTDKEANFSIQGVPAGHYFLLAEVDFLPPASDEYMGQWALERVDVAAGQTLHVMLTHNPGRGRMERLEVLR